MVHTSSERTRTRRKQGTEGDKKASTETRTRKNAARPDLNERSMKLPTYGGGGGGNSNSNSETRKKRQAFPRPSKKELTASSHQKCGYRARAQECTRTTLENPEDKHNKHTRNRRPRRQPFRYAATKKKRQIARESVTPNTTFSAPTPRAKESNFFRIPLSLRRHPQPHGQDTRRANQLQANLSRHGRSFQARSTKPRTRGTNVPRSFSHPRPLKNQTKWQRRARPALPARPHVAYATAWLFVGAHAPKSFS